MNQELANQLHTAVFALLRWTSRPAVRDQLFPGADGFVPSPTDVWLLDALATGGPTRMSALAAWQGVDRSTMTLQVRRLTTAGLVARHSDPSDGRAALVELTPRGRVTLEEVRRAGAKLLTERLADWPASDRAALTGLLARFAAELGGPSPTAE